MQVPTLGVYNTHTTPNNTTTTHGLVEERMLAYLYNDGQLTPDHYSVDGGSKASSNWFPNFCCCKSFFDFDLGLDHSSLEAPVARFYQVSVFVFRFCDLRPVVSSAFFDDSICERKNELKSPRHKSNLKLGLYRSTWIPHHSVQPLPIL